MRSICVIYRRRRPDSAICVAYDGGRLCSLHQLLGKKSDSPTKTRLETVEDWLTLADVCQDTLAS